MVFFARALQGNSFFLGRLLLATIILMVPCIISGQPQVFSDTKSYYVLGQAVGEKLGIAPVQSEAVSLRGKGGGAAAEAREVRLAYTVSASRSPYYSLYLYSGSRIGSAWLLVALQSLLTSALIWIVVDLFEVWLFYELTVALLAFTTSAAIFIFFIMPDFASPLGILAFALLVLKWNMLSWARIALLSVTLLIACVFHTSNLLLVCTLMAMTAVYS
ncbi:hypothetical protein [Sphingomonas adhaesiva]|uniref:hypothetical protein n=1 Tax=Sphingomonas adhaesiva TaxID=28212 RepID=UPI002FFD1C7D